MEQQCEQKVYAVGSEPDIYPCSRCEHLHKSDTPLQSALSYFNEVRLRELLESNDVTEFNPLKYLIGCLSYCSGYKIPCLMRITWSNFARRGDDIVETSKELFLNTLDVVCKRHPELITEEIIASASKHGADEIVSVLSNSFINGAGKPECYICYSTHEYHLMPSPCACKTQNIHLRCLINMVKTNGKNCTTCKTYMNCQVDDQGRVAFPFLDIYPSPLFTGQYTFPTMLNQKIHYAAAYLCPRRLIELMGGMTKKEYDDYCENADYDALHTRVQSGALRLRDMPYTNLSRSNNAVGFWFVEYVFESLHADYYGK